MTAEFEGHHGYAPEQHEYRLPYHWCMSGFHKYVARQSVERVAPILRERSVLEMGCGDGFVTSLIAGYAAHVLGFDMSERAVEFAKLIVEDPRANFAVGRASDLRRVAAEMNDPPDVIASYEVIEHLPEHELHAFVRESFELLPPGGHLIATTPNGDLRRANRNPYHAHELRREELRRIVKDAGFRRVSIDGFYLQPPWPKLEHFANVVPFRAPFRALVRMGRGQPRYTRTLLVVATR